MRHPSLPTPPSRLTLPFTPLPPIHAAKVLLKAAQQPRIACFMCDRQPLHGLFACLGSNCDAESRRVLCCVLQLMTHLLACDAALRAPADFVEHLPFLLEKAEASFPDPHDPMRALVEPVHARLERLLRIHHFEGGGGSAYGVAIRGFEGDADPAAGYGVPGGGALRGALLRRQHHPPQGQQRRSQGNDPRRRSFGAPGAQADAQKESCVVS